MIKEEILDNIKKNVSFLFTINVYSGPFTGVLAESIVNSYFYFPEMESEDSIYVLMQINSIEKFESLVRRVYGYKEHIILNNHYIVILDRTKYINEEAYEAICNSDYSSLMNNELYQKYLIQQGKAGIQRKIVEKNPELLEILSDIFNSNVNTFWNLFNIEKETLTLEKIDEMEKELKISKSWLQNKIDNSSILTKHVYQDVLDNSTEVSGEKVVVSKKKEIDLEGIFNRIKDKVQSQCGKTQYQVIIEGTKYPLLCNFLDFKTKLQKVIIKYKLTDIDKVEKVLINYVSNLRPGMKLLTNYIMKFSESTLAGDYENYSEPLIKANTKTFEM